MKDISQLLRQQKDDCAVLNALLLLINTTIERADSNVYILQSKPISETSGGLCDPSSKQSDKSKLG